MTVRMQRRIANNKYIQIPIPIDIADSRRSIRGETQINRESVEWEEGAVVNMQTAAHIKNDRLQRIGI